MSEWEINDEDVIDYSPNGDDVKTFSLKVKRNIERIFSLLNVLNDALTALTSEQLLMINNSSTNHLKRLVEELHLALSIAGLNTTGHDSLLTKFDFTQNGWYTTGDNRTIHVTSAIKDNAKITVDSTDGLIIGGNYKLKSGDNIQVVKIKGINAGGVTNEVTLSEAVNFVPDLEGMTLIRNKLNVEGGNILVDDECYFVTEPFVFINKSTGTRKSISTVHLNVKHQNIKDADISAEVALINNLKFVGGEVVGIGVGGTQQATLANTSKLQHWGFKLYFDGVEQSGGYVFSPSDGTITFNAPSGTLVTADYFYDWGEEVFRPMMNNGIYVDFQNNSRATTQFAYYGSTSSIVGNAAIIRITMKRGTGGISNETLGVSTGTTQGFKLAHQALESSIKVTPASASWTWHEGAGILTVNAPSQQNLSASYNYRSKIFYVDSFAVMFNE